MNKPDRKGNLGDQRVAVARRRADRLLVERGLFESRARAQAAIEAGFVSAGGVTVRRPSDLIPADADVCAREAHPYVSRGGLKLAAALDTFGIDPSRRICLDVGASTGGFTEVLLGRGAARVYAVDVGRGQLHRRIGADPRVISLEATDARRLDRALIPDPIGLAVVDVSFISLRLVLEPVVGLLERGADLIALIKPQFEAGRALVRKGIVRDENVHRAVCEGMSEHVGSLGLTVLGIAPSPVAGGDGNREFLLGARLA